MIRLHHTAKLCIAHALMFALLFGLANCSPDRTPKITLYKEKNQVKTTNSTSSLNASNSIASDAAMSISGYHTVKKGETLFAIARTYQVPLRLLIEKNELKPPYVLNIGQKLYIPQRPTYRVKSGDTVYGISKNEGVSMNELVRVNNLRSPYQIYTGQELILPGKVVSDVNNVASKAPLNSNANKQNKTIALSTPNPPSIRLKYGSHRLTKSGYPRPYPKPPRPAKKLTSIAKPTARSSSKFLWPIKGRLISGYGTKGKGLYNDGLNIAAPVDSPIKAAENGVVVYAGTELKGYGNLILLKHADGYLTAYAHNSKNLVARGEKIRRGQTIAKVGATGNVKHPQLHFQIRKGKQTVNPKKYLAKG